MLVVTNEPNRIVRAETAGTDPLSGTVWVRVEIHIRREDGWSSKEFRLSREELQGITTGVLTP